MARAHLKLQFYCGDEIAMGPSKADLLQAIEREGSISGAGRALGMSYRRAWMLVDTMNRCFRQPLVEATPGGGRRAGARITAAGFRALEAYRALCAEAEKATQGANFARLEEAIRDRPDSANIRRAV